MKKGMIEMFILHYISIRDLYGYDVMKRMNVYFKDMDTSTFYSILRRLHKEHELESYFVESTGGPARKYYKITEKGRITLEQLKKDWKTISDIANKILQSDLHTLQSEESP